MWQHRKLISEHAFDKLRLIDCTFAEFDAAIAEAEVIEERDVATGVKELLLVAEDAASPCGCRCR